MKLVIAIKAGCGGNEEFYEAVVLPWCLRHEKNTEDYVRRTWESITDAELGADYVYSTAREYDPMFADDTDDILDYFKSQSNAQVEELERSSAASDQSEQPVARGAPVPKLMPADFAVNRLPPRPFVLGYRFMAGAVTLGVAPPGTGKSNFSILTAPRGALSPHRRGAKTPPDRVQQRPPDIFVTSGLDERLVVAIKAQDIVTRSKAVADVIGSIKENGIVHMVIDPFVSTHRGVSENANEEIEQVAEAIRRIAHETGCSIDLIHHSVKSHAGNTESHARDMNAARGASALLGAVRIIYTLSPMSLKTAKDLNIPPHLSARLVRLDHGKGNYSARDPSIRWFELVTVPLENGVNVGDWIMSGGESVAVPVRWQPAVVDATEDRDNPKEEDPKEDARQRVRDLVAKAMQADRCELSSLIGVVERELASKTRLLANG